ncbi:enoyl-CoA hydratase/isomerase family protein [Corynebacterium auriscanis]|uniref:enoyl-CoA hydratase/isomerase family protein n=1 Tax=Corynebacterium auriscanis TaxID=99807 RepID=UPI0022477303|nr:enoyl-CoA hydratase/isomerase family protein [Corynebacterium auriscanis]MCX2162338.1 enoyl-CoA hydratase/isomerase family protein [Corynebacterium auriscanis]
MSTADVITTRVEGNTAIVEMDRPRALNALDHTMILALHEAFSQYESDDSVGQYIICSSSPRAFCAGGDVRWVREQDLANNHAAGDRYFADEYDLNYRLANFPKPVAAVMEGYVMGGGMGISMHGSHRIATPTTVAAMPEMNIGFVPDVGISHVLTHMKAKNPVAMGVFAGTTGWRMNAADMMETGLATNLIAKPAAFFEDVRNQGFLEALDAHSVSPESLDLEHSGMITYAEWISDVFSGDSWQEIERRLGRFTTSDADLDDFVKHVKYQLESCNPTSLVACVEMFRRAAEVDLRTALDNELAVGSALRREPNFAEGVRAVLIDKDRTPKFRPDNAAEVDVEKWRALLK